MTADFGRLEKILRILDNGTSVYSLQDALFDLCNIYEFDHSVFHVTQTSYHADRNPLILTTYPTEWVQTYINEEYSHIDPVVSAGRSGFLPVDWSRREWTSEKTEHFWRQADSFDVGRYGVTLPVRGPFGQRSLFTATSNACESVWLLRRDRAIRDLQVICHYLHQRAMLLSGLGECGALRKLSVRETQCMALLARGRLPKQIAAELQISERCVRVYLTSSRAKLKATTTNQAVAAFVSLEIV